MKSKLNFPHTCPDIDRAIRGTKEDLMYHLQDMLPEICPYIDKDECRRLASEWADKMCESIATHFEEVRDLNEKMREAADDQIKELTATIDNLETKIDNLEFAEYWNRE